MDSGLAEGLSKKLSHLKAVNWSKLGKDPLANKILDEVFIEKHVKSKQKAYNKMPITFNSSILKIGIQERMLRLYSGYFQEIKQTLAPLEGKVDKLINTAKDNLLKPHDDLVKNISDEKPTMKVIQASQQVSEQEINRLKLKQTVLKSIMNQLILSEDEKKVILTPLSKDEGKEFNSAYYELILVLKKILKIKKVIKLIQEYDPTQIIAESVHKDILKDMKATAESKLLAIFKEIANSFESLNILNEIESYDIVKFTSQVFDVLLKGNEVYYTHCVARIRDALRKAVYKDYLRVDTELQQKPNRKVEFKMFEVHSLLLWIVKAAQTVLDIAKSVGIAELIGVEVLFDDILSGALSSIIYRTRNLYKECASENSLGKFYELALIIAEYQKLKSSLLETRVQFTEEEINETAFLAELEEIRQNAFEGFLSLARGSVAKCADLAQRVKDVEDYDKRVIDFFNEVLLRHIKVVVTEGEALGLDFSEETIEMFKTETIFPLISICENLKANTVASICSLINVYSEIQTMLEGNAAFMDTVQLLRSKLMGLMGKVANQRIMQIFAELGVGSVENVLGAGQEETEHVIKRLYEIIFKYKGVEEKQGESFKLLIRSPEVRKQVSEQVTEAILKVYEAACTNLKKYKSTLEIYDVEIIKKSLD